MQVGDYVLMARWGNRWCSINEAGHKISLYLGGLKEIHDLFSEWYLQSETVANATSRGVLPSDDGVVRLLSYEGEFEIRTSGEDYGWSLGMWTGFKGGVASVLHIKCGSIERPPHSIFGGNYCMLELPGTSPVSEELISVDVITRLLELTINVWNPDWATVNPYGYPPPEAVRPIDVPDAGWFTYFKIDQGQHVHVPSTVATKPIGREGIVLILQKGRMQLGNREDVATIGRLSDMLETTATLRLRHSQS